MSYRPHKAIIFIPINRRKLQPTYFSYLYLSLWSNIRLFRSNPYPIWYYVISINKDICKLFLFNCNISTHVKWNNNTCCIQNKKMKYFLIQKYPHYKCSSSTFSFFECVRCSFYREGESICKLWLLSVWFTT